MYTLLLVILLLLLVGAIPSWPYSRSWGYAPSGGLGLVLLILLVLVLMGRICALGPGWASEGIQAAVQPAHHDAAANHGGCGDEAAEKRTRRRRCGPQPGDAAVA